PPAYATDVATVPESNVIVNRVALYQTTLEYLHARYRVRMRDGAYWYDSRSALFGAEDNPPPWLIRAEPLDPWTTPRRRLTRNERCLCQRVEPDRRGSRIPLALHRRLPRSLLAGWQRQRRLRRITGRPLQPLHAGAVRAGKRRWWA